MYDQKGKLSNFIANCLKCSSFYWIHFFKMDIYGYQAYQYNQSDELANQMLSQQPLSSSVPFGRPASEPHYMPAPSGSPWNVQSIPWGLTSPPQLVQFTGQNQGLLPKISTVPHCKRKSLDVEPPMWVLVDMFTTKVDSHVLCGQLIMLTTGQELPYDFSFVFISIDLNLSGKWVVITLKHV